MTTDLDRIRLAAAAELELFEADERRRLAYADRAGTLEQRTHAAWHADECVAPHAAPFGTGEGWQCIPTCAVRIHKAAFLANHRREAQAEHERLMAEVRADNTPSPPLANGTGRHSRKEMEADLRGVDTRGTAGGPSVVAGVQFTSVPQLCAAYEYALETMRSLYLLLDLKQHAWQPEQEVMREARQLLLAAGKDVV